MQKDEIMPNRQFPDVGDHVELGERVFIAEQAYVRGTVVLGDDVSVWPMAVIRGDKEVITIGARTNIQDGAVLHADPDVPLTIGNDVTVGHGAIVHGCTVGDEVLIGMGAVILNHAKVGKHCIIGARALVTEGMEVPDGSLVVGIPGKVRPLREDQLQRLRENAVHYVELKDVYLAARENKD
jgi:carbonic anhydrase/acetyltransferase-like protein (isoleucine patch superfamily)